MITLNFSIVLIASACIGGFIGAYFGYLLMYKMWRIDKKDLFDRLEKEYPKT